MMLQGHTPTIYMLDSWDAGCKGALQLLLVHVPSRGMCTHCAQGLHLALLLEFNAGGGVQQSQAQAPGPTAARLWAVLRLHLQAGRLDAQPWLMGQAGRGST